MSKKWVVSSCGKILSTFIFPVLHEHKFLPSMKDNWPQVITWMSLASLSWLCPYQAWRTPTTHSCTLKRKCLVPALVYFLFGVTLDPLRLRWLWIPRTCVLFQFCQSTGSDNLCWAQLSNATVLLCWGIPVVSEYEMARDLWRSSEVKTSQCLSLDLLTKERWQLLYKLFFFFLPPILCINCPEMQLSCFKMILRYQVVSC